MKRISYSEASARLERVLKESGYRRTRERFAVLEVLYTSDKMLSPEEIVAGLIARNFRISRATMYNALSLLCECGLVERVSTDGRHILYGRVGKDENAVMIRCLRCGNIVRLSSQEWLDLADKIEMETGYAIQTKKLLLHGWCRRCKKSKFVTNK